MTIKENELKIYPVPSDEGKLYILYRRTSINKCKKKQPIELEKQHFSNNSSNLGKDYQVMLKKETPTHSLSFNH